MQREVDLSTFDNSGFDRGAGRIKEGLWWLVRGLFFQCDWPFPSALRASLLRAFGARVGRGVVIRSGVRITFPWRLEIGDHAWIGEEVLILSLARVRIEAHVCVSQRAFLCTGSHDHRKSDFPLITRPITLGRGCWVAAQAFVGPGVQVGPGSVISAGSVVLRNVPPHCIAQGNPAKVVREIVNGEAPTTR